MALDPGGAFEFERFSFGYRADVGVIEDELDALIEELGTAPIQNKVGAFLADPLLDRILTAPKKDLHIRRIMDQGPTRKEMIEPAFPRTAWRISGSS